MIVILIIIFVIFLTIWLVKYSHYIHHKQKFISYNFLKIQDISEKEGSTYNFQTDTLNLKLMVSQMIDNLSVNLLHAYNQNIDTFCNTINSIINNDQIDISTSPSCLHRLPVFSNQKNNDIVISFIQIIMENIPNYVLRESAFFVRFFYIISLSLHLSSNDISKRLDTKYTQSIINLIMNSQNSISPACI